MNTALASLADSMPPGLQGVGSYALDKWNASLREYLNARDRFMALYTDNTLFQQLPADQQRKLDTTWTYMQNFEGVIRKIGEIVSGVANADWDDVAEMIRAAVPVGGLFGVKVDADAGRLGAVQLLSPAALTVLLLAVAAIGYLTRMANEDSEVLQAAKAVKDSGGSPTQVLDAVKGALVGQNIRKAFQWVPWIGGALLLYLALRNKGK